jgi:tetratricopeptide (TPR) repeat protein
LYPAAATFDPLAGSVHYFWSLFDERRSRKLLEQALAVGPDHLCTLGELGAAARAAGDFDRAIELLERYVEKFRALHTGGVRGLFWDYQLAELAIAHYENACVALFGVRPGQQRPAGRPTPEALDRAEAKLAPALALYDSLSYAQRQAGGGVFHCQSQIHEYRGDHAAALEWAERALATDDRSPYFWSTKGGCLNNLDRLDEAIACCEKALAHDKKHWHAHYTIACALAKRDGDRDEIYRHLRRVVAIWPAGRAELAVEPDLSPLRDEPAFRKIVATSRPRRRRR